MTTQSILAPLSYKCTCTYIHILSRPQGDTAPCACNTCTCSCTLYIRVIMTACNKSYPIGVHVHGDVFFTDNNGIARYTCMSQPPQTLLNIDFFLTATLWDKTYAPCYQTFFFANCFNGSDNNHVCLGIGAQPRHVSCNLSINDVCKTRISVRTILNCYLTPRNHRSCRCNMHTISFVI